MQLTKGNTTLSRPMDLSAFEFAQRDKHGWRRTDDLIGEVVDQEDVESIEVAVNGKCYTIALGKKNADEFHKSLDKCIAVATKVGGAGTRKPARGSKEVLVAIRE